jgi:hypothetical protein
MLRIFNQTFFKVIIQILLMLTCHSFSEKELPRSNIPANGSCRKVTVSFRKTPDIVQIFSDGFLPAP